MNQNYNQNNNQGNNQNNNFSQQNNPNSNNPANSNNGFENKDSIFNSEPFNTPFKGFSESKPVHEASVVDSVESTPSGIPPMPPNHNHGSDDSKNKSGVLWNVVGIVVIVLLLIGIGNSVAERRETAKSESNGDLTSEQLEQLANVIFTDKDKDAMKEDSGSVTLTQVDESLADRSNSGRANNAVAYNMISSVKLAVLSDTKSGGVVRGCDAVHFVNRSITPTPAPLNSALRELFNTDIETSLTPGNFLSTQDKLQFVNATIDAGVARIYLTGEVGPYEDGCDQNRSFVQISETAKQFNTVRSVEIYLDGKKLAVN